jgi:hypothetical protein
MLEAEKAFKFQQAVKASLIRAPTEFPYLESLHDHPGGSPDF